MTEYEIADLMIEHVNRIWDVMQFWASISFGLIALCHVAAKRLTVTICLILSMLYISFSIFSFNIQVMNDIIINSYMNDLSILLAQEKLSTTGAQALINTDPTELEMLAIRFVSIGTFLSSLFFLWYSYFKNRNKERDE